MWMVFHGMQQSFRLQEACLQRYEQEGCRIEVGLEFT